MSVALFIAGLLLLALLGLLFKVVLGRYVLTFLLAFVGLSIVVSLVAVLLCIFTVRLDSSRKA